jgi:hypothetical protein
MPIVGRELEEGAFSVPLKAAEIPKVISWQPGVSRPPAPALAPAPSVRNKPSKPVPFAGSDLLLTRSDHRVVAVDVLAIDRREKHRLAGSPAEGLRDRALLLVGFVAAPVFPYFRFIDSRSTKNIRASRPSPSASLRMRKAKNGMSTSSMMKKPAIVSSSRGPTSSPSEEAIDRR